MCRARCLRILRQSALDEGRRRSGALIEDHVLDLLNFEKSTKYDERQKAALAYAEAIVWHLNTDDAFWDRMHRHFNEPELVELGCMIGLTLGQQSWLRLLNIEHHQVMAGTVGVDGAGLRRRQAAHGHESSAGLLGESRRSRPAPPISAGLARCRAQIVRGRTDMYASATRRGSTPPGGLLMVAFFLAVGLRNLQRQHIDDHVKRLTNFKTPFPILTFWIGQTHGIRRLRAGAVSIGIRRSACCCSWCSRSSRPALLLRFWEVEGPMRTGMQNGMLANIGIVGGLLLLLQHVR